MPKENIATSVLDDLEINEGSLVDKGDNPEAHIVLTKKKDDDSDKDAAAEELSLFKRFKSWLRKEETILPEDEGTKVSEDKGANTSPQEGENTENSMKTYEDVLAALPEEDRAVLEAANKAASTDGVEKRLEGIEKRAEAAEAEVATMKAAKVKAECVSKAKALELPGVEIEKLAGVFEKSGDLSADISEILSALKAQIDTTKLFSENGSDADGDDLSALAKLEAKAKEIQTRDGVTFEKAFSDAASENRDLYNAYRKEG